MKKTNLRVLAEQAASMLKESTIAKSRRSAKWDYLCMSVSDLLQPGVSESADSLVLLIHEVRQFILKFGHSRKTLSSYDYYGFGVIYRYCAERGETKYSKNVIDCLINEMRSGYENHTISRSIYQCVRKTAALLEEYHTTGMIEWKRIPNHNARNPQG